MEIGQAPLLQCRHSNLFQLPPLQDQLHYLNSVQMPQQFVPHVHLQAAPERRGPLDALLVGHVHGI